MVPKWCPDVKNKVVKRKTATITRYKKSLCLQGFSQIIYKKICGNTGRFWLFHDPRNQVTGNRPWVRIPPAPPLTRLKRRFQAGFRMSGAIRNRRGSKLRGWFWSCPQSCEGPWDIRIFTVLWAFFALLTIPPFWCISEFWRENASPANPCVIRLRSTSLNRRREKSALVYFSPGTSGHSGYSERGSIPVAFSPRPASIASAEVTFDW